MRADPDLNPATNPNSAEVDTAARDELLGGSGEVVPAVETTPSTAVEHPDATADDEPAAEIPGAAAGPASTMAVGPEELAAILAEADSESDGSESPVDEPAMSATPDLDGEKPAVADSAAPDAIEPAGAVSESAEALVVAADPDTTAAVSPEELAAIMAGTDSGDSETGVARVSVPEETPVTRAVMPEGSVVTGSDSAVEAPVDAGDGAAVEPEDPDAPAASAGITADEPASESVRVSAEASASAEDGEVTRAVASEVVGTAAVPGQAVDPEATTAVGPEELAAIVAGTNSVPGDSDARAASVSTADDEPATSAVPPAGERHVPERVADPEATTAVRPEELAEIIAGTDSGATRAGSAGVADDAPATEAVVPGPVAGQVPVEAGAEDGEATGAVAPGAGATAPERVADPEATTAVGPEELAAIIARVDTPGGGAGATKAPDDPDATTAVPPEVLGVPPKRPGGKFDSETTRFVPRAAIQAAATSANPVDSPTRAIRPRTVHSGPPSNRAAIVDPAASTMFTRPKATRPPWRGDAAGLRDRLRQEFGADIHLFGSPAANTAKFSVSIGENPAFDRWARSSRVRALTIVIADDRLLVGPLSVPGKPGCAACARGRRVAAGAGMAGPPRPDDETTAVVRTADEAALAQLVDLLRADPRELVGHLAELGGPKPVWHRVIPLPFCEVCGGADGIATVGLPDTDEDDPAELLEALAGWVDPLTGVIPWITLRQPLGDNGPHVATAAPPHLLDRGGVPRPLPIGWGKGMTRSAAIVSAVAEAVERYSASLPDAGRLVWARPADLSGEILDPREFPLYEPAQYTRPGFGYVPFDRRIDHPWVRGTWLGTDTPVWVPAVFAYLSMTLLPEHFICQGSSNGLAAGPDADAAVVRATLELVERDAMMTAWRTSARGRYVELDETLDAETADIVDALRGRGPAVEVYLLPTSRYGTTAVALALGDGRRWPGVALGLGADRSPRAAIRTAVLELAQTAPHLAGLLRDRQLVVPARPEAVREMVDHAAFYFPTNRIAAFDRLRCGGTTRLADLPEPAFDTSVADLAGQLGRAGARVAVVDVTSPDVATSPFRVVRAVSPDLQPISYGHGNDRAPVARLRHSGAQLRDVVHPIW
ncbi:YcaO-like family protein [Actinokineospora enzanensis]|uniref:YcaO-like family protein n=1 Tax=Actinokineospora enzanensis TaxID=155975 RepID=UPI000376C0BD|nr:YcaO-like family protein [Actinokineospora enzanensis]